MFENYHRQFVSQCCTLHFKEYAFLIKTIQTVFNLVNPLNYCVKLFNVQVLLVPETRMHSF